MIASPLEDRVLRSLSAIERDGMTVFILAGGRFRGAFLNGTRMVHQMRRNHRLGLLETFILGQAYLSAALMIPTIKGRGRLRLRYDTNGPAAGFAVEADSAGSVRGFLLQEHIPIESPLESWDLSPFLGEGTVSLTRFPMGGEPYTGTVEIRYRHIARDLAWYFLQSEQIHTAFNTSIFFNKEGLVSGAGGLFLQAMPEEGGSAKYSRHTQEELIEGVERAFSAAPSLGQWFAEGGNREDVLYGLFREFDMEPVLERDIIFDCPCSAERFARALRALDTAELEDMKKNGPDPLELICHNCGSVYRLSPSAL